ncbi:hypothetical protein [Halalkalibacter akibai]|uniref:Uncharacterized protein n=1 Tax=Halalkalibacter akibai (strain ATCC 43226 / DSM 21942 / CIP 109018 / JCM 9157 / 1139) TaxID=1236973 RepID=W4QN48_HALA3|nr:hypothetical protein [Halalkalibacter akibai]GAE33525.1 hypothetical protein JCM9157_529 [Halalkalibacter akibai JCM 9157]
MIISESSTNLQSKKQINPYRSNIYGDFQIRLREQKVIEQLRKLEENKEKPKVNQRDSFSSDEEAQPMKQDVTVRQMKEFLSSYYIEENSGDHNFVKIVNRIEDLTKKLISHQINGDKQQWESKLHQFKLEITLEAYKRYHDSLEAKRIDRFQEYREKMSKSID